MKKLTLAVATMALGVSIALAGTATLIWTPVAGNGLYYKVHSSTNGTNWKFERNVTNATTTVFTNPAPAILFYGVQTVNTNGSQSVLTSEERLFGPGSLQIIEVP